MGAGGLGTKVSQQGPGAEPWWGLGAKAPARYAYTICSGQMHFRDVFIEDRPMLWNLGKPSKIRPTVSSRQNIPAV